MKNGRTQPKPCPSRRDRSQVGYCQPVRAQRRKTLIAQTSMPLRNRTSSSPCSGMARRLRGISIWLNSVWSYPILLNAPQPRGVMGSRQASDLVSRAAPLLALPGSNETWKDGGRHAARCIAGEPWTLPDGRPPAIHRNSAYFPVFIVPFLQFILVGLCFAL